MDKEEEINRKIEMLKRKNEQIMQRHQEVEADRMSAEKSGQVFHGKSANSTNESSRGNERGTHGHPRAHMDNIQHDDYATERHRPPHQSIIPRGRGTAYSRRGSSRPAMDDGGDERRGPSQQNTNPRDRGTYNSGRGTSRGRGRGGRRYQGYGEKRLENYRLMEEEISQGSKENDNPPVSRFLDDPRRKGELEPDARWKSTRHKGNFGGLEFDNVRRGMRGRGRGGYHNRDYRGRGMSYMQMSAELTGRERQDQERWQAMREAADKEIQARSKNSEGRWRREWDAEKNESSTKRRNDSSQGDRYDEPRRTYRGGGRGKSGRGRRGSRSSQEYADNDKEKRRGSVADEETVKDDAKQHILDDALSAKPEEKTEPPAMSENIPERSKPQRSRKNHNKSPHHLVQQRAQTPSSKDGTEVWAQNSHHSDEAGADWKNGASRSGEQWLPSNEGNRNPAIDERMLEQQEDGATIYSQQLGRGWGSEKNIKATKAWVIDTEKAGAAKQDHPEDPPTDETRGRDGDRSARHRKFGRRNGKGQIEDSRIREVMSERAGMRSASPRLKRENPGLTVEIGKGISRRVKRHSEGDSSQYYGDRKGTGGSDLKEIGGDALSSSPPIKSPLSAGILKTPEGVKHVDDWATEMDLQSPTYELRQKELQEAIARQVDLTKKGEKPLEKDLNTEDRSVIEDVVNEIVEKAVIEDSVNEVVEKAVAEDSVNEVVDKAVAENSGVSVKTECEPSSKNLVGDNVSTEQETASAGCVVAPPLVSDSPLPEDITESKVQIGKPDTTFQDANEDVEDEFFECDGNEEQTLKNVQSSKINQSGGKMAGDVDAEHHTSIDSRQHSECDEKGSEKEASEMHGETVDVALEVSSLSVEAEQEVCEVEANAGSGSEQSGLDEKTKTVTIEKLNDADEIPE